MVVQPPPVFIYPSHVFFDLDNTLWDDKHPLIKPAWDRLPHALKVVFGDIPTNFRWSDYKGSTDIGLVMNLVEGLRSTEKFLHRSNQELANEVLFEMAKFYYLNSKSDISPANFSDAEAVLSILKKNNVRLGIVSGNDGDARTIENPLSYPAVGPLKLRQAGIEKYFDKRELQFWGGDFSMPTRAELLLSAHSRLKLDNPTQEFIAPFVYVADSPGDYEGVIRAVNSFRPTSSFKEEYDIRLILRHHGDMGSFQNELITKQANYGGYSYRPRGIEVGSNSDMPYLRFETHTPNKKHETIMFGIASHESLNARETNFRVEIVPRLECMFLPDGLLGRSWRRASN